MAEDGSGVTVPSASSADLPPPPPGIPESPVALGVGSLIVEDGNTVLIGGQRFELAPMGRRLTARVLDLVIIAVGSAIGAAIAAPLAMGDTDSSSSTYGLGLGLAVVGFLGTFLVVSVFINECWLVARSGRSLGKAAMNIQVARTDTGGAPGWGKSSGRVASPFGVLLIPYVALMSFVGPKFWWALIALLILSIYLPMIWDPARRSLYDRMAGTIVVRAPRVPVAWRPKQPPRGRPQSDRNDYRPYPGAPPPRWDRGTGGWEPSNQSWKGR